MVLATGLLLWLLAGCVLARAVSGRDTPPAAGGRLRPLGLSALCLVGLVLFMRPHEPMLSGQDHSAYLHAGVRFAREQALVFEDQLLAQVPEPARDSFLYGHQQYGLTKYNCLWIRDVAKATQQPRFQPAFSLLLSVCASLGFWKGALYVTPLFGVLAVLMLGLLAGELYRDLRVGLLGALFLAVQPLWVWHVRFPRPEIVACYFLLGGMILLLRALRGQGRRGQLDAALAALSITLAPFFHVIAWFVTIPCGLAVALVTIVGRRNLAVYLPMAGAGAAAFVCQALFLTDPYGLRRFLGPVFDGPRAVVLLVTGALAAPFFLVLGVRRLWARSCGSGWARRLLRLRTPVRWLLPAAIGAGFVTLYLLHAPIDGREFAGYEYHYAHPSDLRVAAEYVSLPVLIVSLAGILAALASYRLPVWERVTVLLCLVPGTALVGNLYDLFLTRYLAPVMMPLLALGVAGALWKLKALKRIGIPAVLCTAVLLMVSSVWGRTSLITTTDHRGFAEGFGRIAERIRRDDGILLGEYSRVVAPLEHTFGIPSLAFDNQTRSDYTVGLAAWEQVMDGNPGRAAFFLTPYGPPISDRFVFEPVADYHLPYRRVVESRFRFPRHIKEGALALTLYRMHGPGHGERVYPYVRLLDDSNMGLVNFSRGRTSAWTYPATPLDPEAPCVLWLKHRHRERAHRELRLLVATETVASPPPLLTVTSDDADVGSVRVHPLLDEWYLVTVAYAGAGAEAQFRLQAAAGTFLGGAATHGSVRIDTGARPRVQRSLAVPWTGRWARAQSRFLVNYPEGGGLLALFLYAPPETGAACDVSVDMPTGKRLTRSVKTGQWRWVFWPLPRAANSGIEALPMTVAPFWDPEKPKYPRDLGVRVACIIVAASGAEQ